MLKELAESTERFEKPSWAINRRQSRGTTDETITDGNPKAQKKKYYYKNATELFADKTIAFLYVIFCRWAYKSTLDESTLDAVERIHAQAMDSINRMRQGDKNYAFKEVMGLLDKDEENPKTPNNQPHFD